MTSSLIHFSDDAENEQTSGPSDVESNCSTEESSDGCRLHHRQLEYIHQAENRVEAQKNLNNLVVCYTWGAFKKHLWALKSKSS